MERCWRGARRDVGEVLGEMLERCWRVAGEVLER